MLPTQSQMFAIVTSMESKTSLHITNASYEGLWLRFTLAAEEAADLTSEANQSISGYMLRTAVALESLAGTSGLEETDSEAGLLKRIVDALEVLSGGPADGTIAERMVIGAANAVLGSVAVFALGVEILIAMGMM